MFVENLNVKRVLLLNSAIFTDVNFKDTNCHIELDVNQLRLRRMDFDKNIVKNIAFI